MIRAFGARALIQVNMIIDAIVVIAAKNNSLCNLLYTAQAKVAITLSRCSDLLTVALEAVPHLPIGMFDDLLEELIPLLCSERLRGSRFSFQLNMIIDATCVIAAKASLCNRCAPHRRRLPSCFHVAEFF